MLRSLLLTFCVLLAPLAQAFDTADAGTYVVMRRDQTETTMRFHVSTAEGKWKLEQKKEDGSWEDITCEKDCALRESVDTDIQRFFPAKTLQQIDPTCLHNDAFAFCSYRFKASPDEKHYLMVALVTGTPTPVYVKRVSAERE
ncbi:hypothetical protein [Chitinimonas naiadis]